MGSPRSPPRSPVMSGRSPRSPRQLRLRSESPCDESPGPDLVQALAGLKKFLRIGKLHLTQLFTRPRESRGHDFLGIEVLPAETMQHVLAKAGLFLSLRQTRGVIKLLQADVVLMGEMNRCKDQLDSLPRMNLALIKDLLKAGHLGLSDLYRVVERSDGQLAAYATEGDRLQRRLQDVDLSLSSAECRALSMELEQDEELRTAAVKAFEAFRAQQRADRERQQRLEEPKRLQDERRQAHQKKKTPLTDGQAAWSTPPSMTRGIRPLADSRRARGPNRKQDEVESLPDGVDVDWTQQRHAAARARLKNPKAQQVLDDAGSLVGSDMLEDDWMSIEDDDLSGKGGGKGKNGRNMSKRNSLPSNFGQDTRLALEEARGKGKGRGNEGKVRKGSNEGDEWDALPPDGIEEELARAAAEELAISDAEARQRADLEANGGRGQGADGTGRDSRRSSVLSTSSQQLGRHGSRRDSRLSITSMGTVGSGGSGRKKHHPLYNTNSTDSMMNAAREKRSSSILSITPAALGVKPLPEDEAILYGLADDPSGGADADEQEQQQQQQQEEEQQQQQTGKGKGRRASQGDEKGQGKGTTKGKSGKGSGKGGPGKDDKADEQQKRKGNVNFGRTEPGESESSSEYESESEISDSEDESGFPGVNRKHVARKAHRMKSNMDFFNMDGKKKRRRHHHKGKAGGTVVPGELPSSPDAKARGPRQRGKRNSAIQELLGGGKGKPMEANQQHFEALKGYGLREGDSDESSDLSDYQPPPKEEPRHQRLYRQSIERDRKMEELARKQRMEEQAKLNAARWKAPKAWKPKPRVKREEYDCPDAFLRLYGHAKLRHENWMQRKEELIADEFSELAKADATKHITKRAAEQQRKEPYWKVAKPKQIQDPSENALEERSSEPKRAPDMERLHALFNDHQERNQRRQLLSMFEDGVTGSRIKEARSKKYETPEQYKQVKPRYNIIPPPANPRSPRSKQDEDQSMKASTTSKSQMGQPENVDHVLARINAALALRSGLHPENAPASGLCEVARAPLKAALDLYREAGTENYSVNKSCALFALKNMKSMRLYCNGNLWSEAVGYSKHLQPDPLRQLETDFELLYAKGLKAHHALLCRLGPGNFQEDMTRRWPVGANWESIEAVPAAEFAHNPGPKSKEALRRKAAVRYGPSTKSMSFVHVLDIARVGLVFKDAASLLQGLEEVIEAFEVLQVRNFYSPKLQNILGDRYIEVLIVVQHELPEPHVCELRLEEASFFAARTKAASHLSKVYAGVSDMYCDLGRDHGLLQYQAKHTLTKPKEQHAIATFRAKMTMAYGSTIGAWRRALGNLDNVEFSDFRRMCQHLRCEASMVELWEALESGAGGNLSLFELDAEGTLLLLRFLAFLLHSMDREADELVQDTTGQELFRAFITVPLPDVFTLRTKGRIENNEFVHLSKRFGLSKLEAEHLFELLDSGAGPLRPPPSFVTPQDFEWLRKLPTLLGVESIALMSFGRKQVTPYNVLREAFQPSRKRRKGIEATAPMTLQLREENAKKESSARSNPSTPTSPRSPEMGLRNFPIANMQAFAIADSDAQDQDVPTIRSLDRLLAPDITSIQDQSHPGLSSPSLSASPSTTWVGPAMAEVLEQERLAMEEQEDHGEVGAPCEWENPPDLTLLEAW